jgi:hypothetical protein
MFNPLEPYVERILEQSAIANHEEEVCGIVTNDGDFVAFQNISEDRVNHFQINASAIAPHFGTIRFIWHTHHSIFHPDLLTTTDIELSRKLGVAIAMLHISTKQIDYYEPKNPNPFPVREMLLPNWKAGTDKLDFYVGWQSNELLWGRTDCFEVVRCYYLGVLNHDIGNFTRPDFRGFPPIEWKTPWIAEEHGLSVVDDIQDNDILEIALNGGRNANHLAVVVDAKAGYILHQPGFDHLSMISRLGGFWRDRIAINDEGRHRILRKC